MSELAVLPILEDTTSDTTSPYGNAYYLTQDGCPQTTFDLNDLTVSRAQAIAETAGLSPGDSILDYGCGLGAMTAAFKTLGYDACGVDPSRCAVDNVLTAAKPNVRLLDESSLSGYDDNSFGLALAKDVFEHVPSDEIPELTRQLLRVAARLLLVIPTVGNDGRFIFNLYERDPTHITRLTGQAWLALLAASGAMVQECSYLTPKIRRPDKVAGTLSVLLS
ncbi:MAG: class I SAM-dependent methyltransferase [Candidatus Saccharimonadales bacterium]